MTARTSKAPLILGSLGCLCLVISMAMFGAFWIRFGKPVAKTIPKPEMSHYTNSPVGRMGMLAESYVDFGFDYPKTWTIKEQNADSPNFVAVERRQDERTMESLTVGYFKTAGSREGNEALYGKLIEQLQQQFSGTFQNLRKISEGRTRVGPYDAYEAVFAGTVTSDGQVVQIYSRPILVQTEDGSKGVTLLLLGTSFNPDLTSPTDLGVKGELPLVVSSFRFGS